MGVIGNLMFAVGFKVTDSALKKAEKETGLLTNMVTHLSGAIAGLTIGAIGFQAIQAAADFTNAMTQIQQSTNLTNEQLEATKGIATNLYNQNFGQDWADLGNAISITTQITQQQGQELENTTRNALLFRDAFGKDIPESVRTADTMMKQFGISSEDAFSLMAQGQQQGLDKSGDLMDTANEYANQFKSLGFTAEEMFDTLAAGSQNGAFNLDKVGKQQHCRLKIAV
ncbi:phage tail tape measure protein [Brevibacillus nitrificans]|uniref:phage tail tape measure protein n=1 Tax=Brevibacillus nitrificans TaxID=651560 RepID=UPI00263250FB|nr:phage tail tape measure protein [Brevibacillus nitrificans]